MKVLIVHPCKGFYGGAEEVVVQLTNYLYNLGHYVIVTTKDAPIELFEKGKGNLRAYLAKSWLDMRGAVQEFSKQVDVINVHNFPATLAAFPTRKPIVWMCNEPPELFTNWWRRPIESFNRWWVKKSGMKVIVADEFNALRFYGLYKVEPIVIPYGVDYKFWSQGTRIKRDGPIKLLQVGIISHYKNQLESIITLCELVSLGIDATLTLVGSFTADAYYFKSLQDYMSIADEELPGFYKRVEYTGQIAQEQVRELYYQHDILLHPIEGQGGWLVPFEAMCAKLPVITTTDFSAALLIDENNLGIVSGPSDMVSWIKEGGYKEIDTEKAKEWVRENLTWEKFGESMIKVFKEVIND